MHKKRLALLLIFATLVSFLMIPVQNITASELSVYINSQPQNFTPAPILKSGTTLVPMRAFFEALDAEVGWDNTTMTATGKRDGITVSLTIGSKTAYINNQQKILTVPAQLINGSTFIPLRFVGEAFGDTVEYIHETGTIKITKSAASQKEKLRIHFIDVGQGDAILIQFPSGQNMLIDAGEDKNTVGEYITNQGIKRLDHIMATHPHADHIGGMANIIESFEIDKVYMPKATHTSRTYENLLLAIKEKGLKITTAKAGLNIDTGTGVEAQLVGPNSESYDNLNNYSAVLRISYGNTNLIFTGDAESISETEMVNSGYTLKSDVLKVGHHGSDSSTTTTFLKAVSPKYAVISVGKDNKYGHPHQEILARLNNADIEIYRTDESGTIIVESDGSIITFDKQASDIKERAPTPTTPDTENYIGNKNTKKFHLPSCKSLPAEQNRVFFDTRDNAVKSGYEPCKICKP